jgi:hypothetical protein
MEGLIELARLAKVPVQRMARTSPGTAITSMQLDRAFQDHILIPWRKGEPERFKTASFSRSWGSSRMSQRSTLPRCILPSWPSTISLQRLSCVDVARITGFQRRGIQSVKREKALFQRSSVHS